MPSNLLYCPWARSAAGGGQVAPGGDRVTPSPAGVGVPLLCLCTDPKILSQTYCPQNIVPQFLSPKISSQSYCPPKYCPIGVLRDTLPEEEEGEEGGMLMGGGPESF